MQRKLIEIEDALAVGISYLDVGWPAFAWLPYLSKRFAGSFAFAHLVRNPFQVAASLTTHGLFSPTIRNGRQFERRSMIHTSDPILYNHEIAKEGMEFSPFERNLFHWLELNQYLLEQHDKEGFLGLFRFEELYEEGPNDIKKLLDGFLGEAKYDLSTPPVDNIQRTLPEKIASPNSKLVAAVFELATSLGYSEHELRASADLDALNKRYASTRKPGSN
ncbi:hypothetical protein RA28_13370 [Ruegeria sp. ANG-S4]|nr:hypothetical protein RA28_13370 [Ruegeria sp. ANG-S4]